MPQDDDDRPLCKLGAECEIGEKTRGLESLDGYCSMTCREAYFESIGAGNITDTSFGQSEYIEPLTAEEREYIRNRPSPA